MEATIFYSWQSDTRSAANRSLILEALKSAIQQLKHDKTVSVEPVVDRDTLAVPGAPDIGATIFAKIDRCSAFVADVTTVNSAVPGSRPTPNPNVLVELGYALKAVGPNRLVLVQNTAFGGPELLPFDLRQKRVLTYESPPDAAGRAGERGRLKTDLRRALGEILSATGPHASGDYPAELVISWVQSRSGEEKVKHRLQVHLTNLGPRTVTEWHVDVQVPSDVLREGVSYHLRVAERSDEEYSLFRSTQETHRKSIYPGDRLLVLDTDWCPPERDSQEAGRSRGRQVLATAYLHGQPSVTAKAIPLSDGESVPAHSGKEPPG